MGHWLYRNVVEPGKLPLLLALIAFMTTFLVTRVVVRMIRAGKGPFGNVRAGGLHIHHVVPGVILTVVGGFGAAASNGNAIGASVSAVLFGIGAGLVLDEFALILHLDDVYWSEEGRQSVEMVVVTAALVGLMLVGFAPFGVNDLSQAELQDRGAVLSTVGVNVLFAVIALVKGKPLLAVFGVIIPVVALVGAVRLARPGSPWARRFYRRRPQARARAARRAYRHDRRWAGPSRTLQDWIGGRPDPPPPPGPGAERGSPPGRGPDPARLPDHR
ncbi:hypothetical protein [Streptomyces sp. NPDC047000]|uniref:hypothetical protein n=1 Tax=Streptomyces sp. NPDC047000 TaxID=3155474 RepID=UPI0033C55852